MAQRQISGEERSLQALLETIDYETATARAQDMALLKEQSTRNMRKRTPHIAFILGDHEMALPIDGIQEVGDLPSVTPLPHLPLWIKGIVQIRGEILSVIDLVTLFEMKDTRRVSTKQFFIYFKQQELKFCLVVNRIIGVVNIDEKRDRLNEHNLHSDGEMVGLAELMKGILSVNNRNIYIIDSDRLGRSSRIMQWR